MKLLVLDLEMNQPSGRIIQIGYVIVDVKTQKVVLERSLIVDPKEPLNPYIVDLTGITEDQILTGDALGNQYQRLLTDCQVFKVSNLPVQWGWGDHNAIREQLGMQWEDYVFKRRAIDVKGIYQGYAAIKGLKTKAGLSSALKCLNLEFEGRPHNALDDARNTWYAYQVLANKMLLADKLEKVLK